MGSVGMRKNKIRMVGNCLGLRILMIMMMMTIVMMIKVTGLGMVITITKTFSVSQADQFPTVPTNQPSKTNSATTNNAWPACNNSARSNSANANASANNANASANNANNNEHKFIVRDKDN